MADGKETSLDERLHFVRQLKKPDRVRHRRATLADLLGDIGLREVEAVLERLVAYGLFDRVQILAVDVLRRRHDRRGLVVDVLEDDFDLLPSDQLRGPETTLARDELVATGGVLPDGRRLDKTVVLQRFGEFLEFFLLELAARLERAALDIHDVELEWSAGLRRRRRRRGARNLHGRRGDGLSGGEKLVKPSAKPMLFLRGKRSGGRADPRSLLQKWILLLHSSLPPKYPLKIGRILTRLSRMMLMRPIWKPHGHSCATLTIPTWTP